MQTINGFECKCTNVALHVSNVFTITTIYLNSDTKLQDDLSNRFFIGTSFMVKPKEEKKSEQESDEPLEMPPTPNINDLYDDPDDPAWVK